MLFAAALRFVARRAPLVGCAAPVVARRAPLVGRAAPVVVCVAPLVAWPACAPAGAGPVVSAPAEPTAHAAASPRAAQPPAAAGATDACSQPWTLDNMPGGPGRVVVVCGNEVRREELDPAEMTRAIAPALEPARARVCGCAARLHAPAYVDLVVTSMPADGRATVQATASEEDDADPELGPPFAACIGTVVASFDATRTAACPAGERAALVYPVRVELAR